MDVSKTAPIYHISAPLYAERVTLVLLRSIGHARILTNVRHVRISALRTPCVETLQGHTRVIVSLDLPLLVISTVLVSKMAIFSNRYVDSTVRYMRKRCSREGMYRVQYCPGARSIIHLSYARLGWQSVFCSSDCGQSPVHKV